jgi:hypothetical protein
MSDKTNIQAEKLALLARDLTLFPESRDSILAEYGLTTDHLTTLEENPIFQTATNHALQQLQDDPIYPQRLKIAAKTSVLAERLLNEAICGTMEHGNSIKVLEFSSKIANMEPPKVTRAQLTSNTSITSSGIDTSLFREAAKTLSTEELTTLDALVTKMNAQPSDTAEA